MTDTLDTLIQALLAPVVMISACGLLILSTSARQTFLLTRVRTLHRERVEAFLEDPQTLSPRRLAVRRLRLQDIDRQTEQLLGRLRLTRDAMLLLFACIAAMVLSSLAHGLALFASAAEYTAIALFIIGMLCTLAAMLASAVEIARSLEAIRFENARIQDLESLAEEIAGARERPA